MKIIRLLSDKTKISHCFRLKNNTLPLLSKKKEIVSLHPRKTLKHNYQNKLLICALVLLFVFHLSAQEKNLFLPNIRLSYPTGRTGVLSVPAAWYMPCSKTTRPSSLSIPISLRKNSKPGKPAYVLQWQKSCVIPI